MKIYPNGDGTFCVSDGFWFPGVFESEAAAKEAVTLQDYDLTSVWEKCLAEGREVLTLAELREHHGIRTLGVQTCDTSNLHAIKLDADGKLLSGGGSQGCLTEDMAPEDFTQAVANVLVSRCDKK